MRFSTTSLLSALALTAPVLVGGAALAAGTITSGNAQYVFPLVPVNSSNLGDGTLQTDGPFSNTTLNPDHLYKNTWYYRTQNNNVNRFFSSLDTPAEVYAGDTATFTYLNAGPGVAGAGDRFNAVFTTTLTDNQTIGSSTVTTRLVFTNLSATATRTFQLFNIIDLDLQGTSTNDTLTRAEPTKFSQSDGATTTVGEVTTTVLPSFVQIGSGSSVRAVTSGGATNFNNVTAAFTGDAALGLQWTLVLGPSESRTIEVSFAINPPAPVTCGTADFDNDGDSGTDGDIEAFFACLAGTCCDTCFGADFDGDGDTGTDADIEAFFRVLAGQPC